MQFLLASNSSGAFTCFYEIGLCSVWLFLAAGKLGTQTLPSRMNCRRAILHVAVVLMVKSAKCSWWVVNLIAVCCCCHHSCLVGKTMAALAAGCRCQRLLALARFSGRAIVLPVKGVFWEHNYFNSLFTQIRSPGYS